MSEQRICECGVAFRTDRGQTRCVACRRKYNSRGRRIYRPENNPDVSYSSYEINRMKLEDGITFLRVCSNGSTRKYRIENGRLCYVPHVCKTCGTPIRVQGGVFCRNCRKKTRSKDEPKLREFYKCLKGCPEGWTRKFAFEYWSADGSNIKTIDGVLANLDNMGLLISEDNGRIYAWDKDMMYDL